MATDGDVRRIALSLEGTTEAPHFDRIAYRARRIYATTSPDRKTINLMLTIDEQALKVTTAPEIYSPVPNAWGQRGATTAILANMDEAELRQALETAWRHGVTKRPER